MRHSDWQQRLHQYLAGCSGTPFSYGRFDCFLFTAGAVNAMTGFDFARGWRGYRSLKRGYAVLRKAGFADHVELVRTHFQPTDQPCPGDIAVMPSEDGPALAIVQGEAAYAVAQPGGWTLAPLADATQFLRV